MQKYLNFHFSVSLDLFGQEASTNAANYYTMGVKGRYLETRIEDDHLLTGASFDIDTVEDGRIVRKTVPALSALNERLRNDYVEDCAKGLLRWNRVIEQAGIDFELKLPHRGFNRRIGAFTGSHVSPDGKVLSEAEWKANEAKWLPTDEDRAYVTSLMGPAVVAARQVRPLDRPAGARHQRPARRLRVRTVQLMAGGISIHVYDVSRGVPAGGLRVELNGPDGKSLASGAVGPGGAFDHPTVRGEGLLATGTYEALFHIGTWYRTQGVALPSPAFLETVSFRFGIADLAQHYHLPLKMTPWGFSLFRGGA